jgi:integrase/recombinase XerC
VTALASDEQLTAWCAPLADLWDAYRTSRTTEKLSAATWDRYQDQFNVIAAIMAEHLGRTLQPSDLEDAEGLPAAFAAYAQGARRDRSPGRPRAASTVAGCLSAWLGFCDWLAAPARGVIRGHPMRELGKPTQTRRAPKPLRGGVPTVLRLLASAAAGDRYRSDHRNPPWPQRDTAVLTAYLTTGMRQMELANLNRRHYDPASRMLLILGDTKTHQERWVPVMDELAAALDVFERTRLERFPPAGRARPRPDEPLLLDDRGRRLNPRTITWMVERCYAAAGISGEVPAGATVHTLRHTCLTLLAADGANAHSLAALAGHSVATSQLYVKIAGEHLREIVSGSSVAQALRAARTAEHAPDPDGHATVA